MTKLAILMCDKNCPELKPNQDSLKVLYEDYFSETHQELSFYSIIDHIWPEESYDHYLITGSKYSVIDRSPWMQDLETFIRKQEYKKLIGICFGHQIIAQALGGRVEREAWHLGVHPIHYTQGTSLYAYQSPLSVRFNHQDQVKQIPENAVPLYTSAQCEYAAFEIDNKILSMQYHPEYTLAYHKILLESKRSQLSVDEYEEGKRTLDRPTNHDIIKNQIIDFLEDREGVGK